MHNNKTAVGFVLAALIATTAQGSLNAQIAPPPLAGDYEGTIGPLHLVLHLRQSAGTGLTGTIDSIDQDVFGIRCADITETGMKFSFTEPELQASYQGEISPDGNTIAGTSRQSGSAPLVFTRKEGTDTDYAGMLGQLRLMLHLRQSAGTGLTGSIESIDHVAFGGRCADVTKSGMKFTFTVPELQEKYQSDISLQGNYQGEISSDGNTITGTWEESGSAPLVFTRRPETDATGLKTDTKSENYGRSAWVYFGPNGRLAYKTTPRGDRIPDFSSAGYRGGGIALPQAPTRVTVSPSGTQDDTPMLQAAIDKVGSLPRDSRGIRGAIVLAPGTFNLAGTLHVNVSGVVIRGAGSEGVEASVLHMTGKPHLAIEIKGDYHRRTIGPETVIKDTCVPAGSTLIHLADAKGIHPGDIIEIVKPVTPEWVHFMGMDHLVRNGQPETWVGNDIRVFRKVASVNGNAVGLEVPLTDSFDSRFYGTAQPTVTPVAITGRIEETGVENLRIIAPSRSIDYHQDRHFDGIAMDNIVDSWLRGITFVDTTNSVSIGHNAERLTVVLVDVQQNDTVTSHAQPFDFSVAGSQILLDRCRASGDRVTYVATQSNSEGPVVVLHCRFSGSGQVEGHQRWSTGLLVDGSAVPDGRINLRNRGELGSGHGWASGWSVLWNSEAEVFLVQDPPGSLNWSIGDMGEHISQPMPVRKGQPVGPPLPGGEVESVGRHVKPASLYVEQLRERRGPAAVAAIGYR